MALCVVHCSLVYQGSSASSAHVGYARNPSTPAGARTVSTISEEDSSDSQSDAYPFLSRYIHRSQPTNSSLWLRDLELLHHWTTEAFGTLSQRPDIQHMWRVEAPKEANAHRFFMHELLAFAALHKSYQQPQDQRQPYYACGIHHQDLAIRGVRQRLQNVTDDDAPAILATSTLLTLSVFASTGFEAQIQSAAASVDDVSSIMNAFHLMQGMGHVLAMAQVAVRDSFMRPMLTDPKEVSPSQPVLQELKNILPALSAFFEGRTDLPEAERKLYLACIACFEPALQVSLPPRSDNRELRFLFFWPLHLGPDFMESLQQRRSGAVVILMYYAVVLVAAESRYWFMEGWGHRVMKASQKVVDQSWAAIVQWPLSFLEHTPSWTLFADVSNRVQASGGGASTSHQPSTQPPQRELSTAESSTYHGEPSQLFSLQRRGSTYVAEMGSAVDETIPEEE